jgi:hypothetical protein
MSEGAVLVATLFINQSIYLDSTRLLYCCIATYSPVVILVQSLAWFEVTLTPSNVRL